jgi:hypothetical protein
LSISTGGPCGIGWLVRGQTFGIGGFLFSYEGLFVGVALLVMCRDEGPFDCWGTNFLAPGFGCSGGGASFFPGGCGFGDGGRGTGGLQPVLNPGVRPPGVTTTLRGMICLPPAGSRNGMGGACRGGTTGGVVSLVDGVDDDVIGGGEGRRGLGVVRGCELSSPSADDVR